MATIDDLLRRLHHQAAELTLSADPDQLNAHLLGWAPLARHALRTLDALDPRPEDREIYTLLQPLSRGRGSTPGRSDHDVDAMALTLGAIGDILISSPKQVADAGQAQRDRMQATILAALHGAARATVEIARSSGRDDGVEQLQKVAEMTQLAALLPPRARVSSLERLTVTPLNVDTIDGGVALWAREAQRTLNNYRLVTGVALIDTAATLALLCGSASTTCREAARRRIVDPEAGRAASFLLADASEAWRRAANWPANIQLAGRAHDYRRAMQDVRHALGQAGLSGLTLRGRLGALRAAVDSATEIGHRQVGATRLATSGRGLWVAHDRENIRPRGMKPKQLLEWGWMEFGDPAGLGLTKSAEAAQQSLVVAAEALDHAVLPVPGVRGEAFPVTLVEHRIAAGWWEMVGSAEGQNHRPDPQHGSPPMHLRRDGVPR